MSRPIRVLHVLEALEGGTARHVVDLVRWTPGVDQHVATPEQRVGGVTDLDAVPALWRHGAVVHPLAMTRSPATAANARAAAALLRLVRRLRPDVLHAHSSIGGLLGRTVGRVAGVPTLYTPNGVTDVRAGVAVERALGPLTTCFVAVSESEAARVRTLRLVGDHRLRVVANGIDPDEEAEPIDLRALLRLPAGVPLVGTISRLVPQKDPVRWVEMAARVGARLPEAHFVVVGDGALRPAVDAAVAASGLGRRFHLVPHLPGASRALGSLDVFVLSSVFEGAPYAPMEAMRAGTPVVLTDVAGSADIVTDGVDGRLVPPRDPEALAAAVLDVLCTPGEAERCAAEGRRTVARRFAGSVMGEAVAALYREALARREPLLATAAGWGTP